MIEIRNAESGVQLLLKAISKSKPCLVNLSPEMIPQHGPKQKEIIEITGESNTGKTLHLMELIALAIIPIEFGGKNAEVIIIDNNSNFHIPNMLAKIIEKHILHHNMKTSTDTEDLRQVSDQIQDTVLYALDKIKFLKCYSNSDFEFALLSCSEILAENPKISLIAIDLIDSFYWTDENIIRLDEYIRQITKEIQKLTDEYGTVAIYTRSHPIDDTISNDDLVHYKIRIKSENGIHEALTFYKGQLFRRRFTINDFGINWISSSQT